MVINVKKAKEIMVPLINYIKDNQAIFPCDLLALEVNYAKNSRRADCLIISKSTMTAIEIKSDGDNLYKLNNQIKDYKKSFDYTYVLTTPKHLNSIKQKRGIGILLFKNQQITLIKPAIQQKELNKEYLLSMLGSDSKNSIEDLSYIKTKVVNKLKKKFGHIYEKFNTESSMYKPSDPIQIYNIDLLYQHFRLKYWLGC
ncbi:hypothetical protein HPDP_00857 [Candidatus Hepatincola sp. Pdp]